MVRTRNVVTQWDRRVVTNENRTCGCYLLGEFEGVACLYFQVLRSICLNNCNGLVKRPCQNDCRLRSTESSSDSFALRGLPNQTRKEPDDLVRQCFAGGDEDGSSSGVMLGLTDQVGTHEERVCALVRQNRNLCCSSF